VNADDLLDEGVAWMPLVNDDVRRILDAPHAHALDDATLDALLLVSSRCRSRARDLRAHLWRIRSARLARQIEVGDLIRDRAAAVGVVAAAARLPQRDRWAPPVDGAPEPCL